MHHLYPIEQLRRIEQQQAARLPPGTLMQRAGQAAAHWIDGHGGATRRAFLVLCGPGDNGGDGFVCAAGLRQLGHAVQCWAPQSARAGDAVAARGAWLAGGGTVIGALPDRCDAVIDALFGIGLARPLADPWLAALAWARSARVPLYALDLPSGLQADTGAWVGGVPGAEATATITFLGDKPGLHTLDGQDAAGIVRVETLGVDAGPGAGKLNGPAQFPALLAGRRRNVHKGHHGELAVVGGAPGMVGAVLLAARAGLRLGAGRVYVACVDGTGPAFDPLQPELMFRRAGDLPPATAMVLGCGMGRGGEALHTLEAALASATALVLDADALNLLPARGGPAAAVRGAPTVLTPHPLEAARLLDCEVAAVQSDRVAAACTLAARSQALVVLKGAGSVIAAPDGAWSINPSGGPALASAGTGDVLAGMIGALLAQGHPAWAAVNAAVWLHGRAADVHGTDAGLVASEVAVLAAGELARLRSRGGAAPP